MVLRRSDFAKLAKAFPEILRRVTFHMKLKEKNKPQLLQEHTTYKATQEKMPSLQGNLTRIVGRAGSIFKGSADAPQGLLQTCEA